MGFESPDPQLGLARSIGPKVDRDALRTVSGESAG